jgi:autotransporter-associated beta strand protein
MNATGGTLTLSGDNSGATGGVTLTAGTLNINNNNALGSGALSLAGTGATINNTSGTAVSNAVSQTWTWSDGLAFGSATNTAANNLNLGTGVVTATSSRTIALAGTNTKLTIGAVNMNRTNTTGGTITANGTGNTLEMGGLALSGNTSNAVTVNLDGTADLAVTGAIVNGQNFANGVVIKGTGAKTFSGANTYTGETEIVSGATLNYGANDVTADAGGRMYVNGGTLNIGSYTDTVSSVRVNAGGAIDGTGTLTTTGSFILDDNNTVNAVLAGAMTLTKTGAGFESLLNGNNTYGGTTTVSSGTLKLGSNTALGSTAAGTTTSSGGLLDLNGTTIGAEALTFTGSGGLLNSSESAASQSGTVAVGDFTTVNTTGDITLSGNLTGIASKSLTKEGAGILKLSSSGSTLAGTLKVSAGTLLVTGNGNVSTSSSIVNGGTLRVNGTAGGVTVNEGGSLEGNGTVGAVTLKDGSFLKPGNSPGLLTASLATWEAGSTYNWEIDNADGTAGINWDLFSVTGALDLSDLSSSKKMNLVLASLSTVTNFSATTPDSWVFAQAGSLVGNAFTAGADVTDLFNINATAFNNGTVPANGWRVEVGDTGKTLNLMAVPEPSTGSMFGLGLAGLVVTRLLRRKNS